MSQDAGSKGNQTAPVLAGRFAIFTTPDGGYHLAYRPDESEEDEHVQIPGFYVKLMRKRAGSKGLLGMIGMGG